MEPIIINENDFINLACDFKEVMTEEQKTRNPYTFTEKERTDFIKKTIKEEPDKFTRYGYHIKNDGSFYWSVKN